MNLSNAYGDLGDARQQLKLLERALAIDERELGPAHADVATTLVNLSNAHGSLGSPSPPDSTEERIAD